MHDRARQFEYLVFDQNAENMFERNAKLQTVGMFAKRPKIDKESPADLQVVHVRATVPSARVALELQLVARTRCCGERLPDAPLRTAVATPMDVEGRRVAVVVGVRVAIAVRIAVVAVVAAPTSHAALSGAFLAGNQSSVGDRAGPTSPCTSLNFPELVYFRASQIYEDKHGKAGRNASMR